MWCTPRHVHDVRIVRTESEGRGCLHPPLLSLIIVQSAPWATGAKLGLLTTTENALAERIGPPQSPEQPRIRILAACETSSARNSHANSRPRSTTASAGIARSRQDHIPQRSIWSSERSTAGRSDVAQEATLSQGPGLVRKADIRKLSTSLDVPKADLRLESIVAKKRRCGRSVRRCSIAIRGESAHPTLRWWVPSPGDRNCS